MITKPGDPEHPTVVVDFDDTIAPGVWPGKPTELMPGAYENLKRLHDAGVRLVVASARLSPMDPWGNLRAPGEVMAEIQWMRHFLDTHGLVFMDIHTGPGKPGAHVYVDDKAERYNKCKRCWNRVADKILIRLGKEIR